MAYQNDLVFCISVVCILKWQTMFSNRAFIFFAKEPFFIFRVPELSYFCEGPTIYLLQNWTKSFF